MERIMWLVLGAIALVAALRAGSSARAMFVARAALILLMVVFGAGVNAAYLISGSPYYERFAAAAPFAFVRDTWSSLVVPNQWVFISLLILAELVAGILIAVGGLWMRAALIGLITFHLGQLVFGWFMWVWAIPMIVAFLLLLRAQRHTPTPPLYALPRATRTAPS